MAELNFVSDENGFISFFAGKHTTEIYKWSDEETCVLLELYTENYDNIGPRKRFRNKKEMWAFISQECGKMHNIFVTPDQVEGRFKTVIKKTKAILENNRTSGAVRKKIPYESLMDKILQKDDPLLPEVFVGPNEILRKETVLDYSDDQPSFHFLEIYKWSDEETCVLLDLYAKNYDNVGPLKRFHNKKDLWEFISQECGKMHNIFVTPDQAEGRFKTVVKKTKAVLKNNRTSGAVRKKISYESLMDKILEKDDSLVPEVFLGPNETYKWSDEETCVLLDLYAGNYDNVGPLKRFRHKKEMWAFISQECGKMHNIFVTPDQVEGRFKTVVKKTKTVLKNNRTSGAVRKKIPYESSMEKILQNDDSLVPEVFVGPNKILRKETESDYSDDEPIFSGFIPQSQSDSAAQIGSSRPPVPRANTSGPTANNPTAAAGPTPPRKRRKCFAEKMIDRLIANREARFEKKEENKERRHREKMEKLTEIENVLKNYFQNKPPS